MITPLPCPSPADVWRLKAVAQAQPDVLARVLLPLEAHSVVPSRLTAQRSPVRSRSTPVLEIEIELAAAELAADAFRFLAATIAELPAVLTTVVS